LYHSLVDASLEHASAGNDDATFDPLLQSEA